MASAALDVETESPCQHEEKRGSKEEKRLGGGFGTSEARPKLKARRERGPVKIFGQRRPWRLRYNIIFYDGPTPARGRTKHPSHLSELEATEVRC